MRDVLLALFLLTAFPLVLYRYQIGALVIVFISCMYPQSNTFGFALTIPWLDFFFAFSIAGFLLKQGYKDYHHHPLITFLILLYLWVSLSTVFAISPYYAYDPWMKFTKVLILALVAYAMLTNKIRLMAYIKVMVLSFGFYGLKGGIFTINNGGTSHVLGPINSFFADNNGMALVLVMVLPFMVFLISHAQNLYQRYFALFCTLCTGIAILGTQSRTGTAALAAAGIYFIWLQKKLFKSILIVAPIICVAYFYMPDSWTERMASTTELESDDSF